MLGHRLVIELVSDSDFEVHGVVRSESDSEILALGPLKGARLHSGIDLQVHGGLEELIETILPDVVVNAAGVIKQKLVGQSKNGLTEMNTDLPRALGHLAQEHSFKLINISTDCVFSGAKGQYTESDDADCADEYGFSKLRGEECGANSLVLRTSIIGRELKGAFGLLEWFLSMKDQAVKGYENAFFSGLSTNEFSRVLRKVIVDYPNLSGLFHVAGKRISKADLLELANELFDLGAEIERVVDPFIDRSLDSTRFNRTTSYTPPTWREMLSEIAQTSDTYERWRNQKF